MWARRRRAQPNGAWLVGDVLRERAAAQLAQLDGLNTKASAALGFTGLLLGLLFANSSITDHWNLWMTAAVTLLALGAVALADSLRVQKWMIKPTEQKLRSWTKAAGQTEQLLAAALEDAIVHNRVQTTSKVRRMHVGMALLTAAITVAAIGLMVARYDSPHATSVPRHNSTNSGATR